MRLSSEEASLLLDVVTRRVPDLMPWVVLRGMQGLHPRQRARLSSALADELQATGFTADWTPNRRGIALEHLLDAVPLQSIEPEDAEGPA